MATFGHSGTQQHFWSAALVGAIQVFVTNKGPRGVITDCFGLK